MHACLYSRRTARSLKHVAPQSAAALLMLAAPVQAELLDAAAPLVRPGGGVLVYSTCSIEPEENQQQVRVHTPNR